MVLLLALAQTASFWANRTRRFSVIAGGTVLQQGGTAVLSLFAGLSGGAQLGLVAGRLGGQCLSAVWLVSRVFSEWRHVLGRVSWSGMKAAVSRLPAISKFNLPYSLVGTVSRELLVFALTLFHFTQQAGFYGLARSVLYSPVSFLSSSLSQVFYKEAADSIGTPAFKALVARLLGGIILVFTPAFVALVFWGPELFAFAFGAKWREAGVYAAIFAPAAWLFLFSSWPERIFEVAGRQQLSLAIQLVSDILSVTVVLALLWQEASPRVVLAAYTAIACAYHCAFVTAAFNVARLPVSILWGAVARSAIMIVAAAAAFAACRQFGPRQGLVVAIALTALYSGTCACLDHVAPSRPHPFRTPGACSVIVVVDYGMGNVGSVANMLRKVGTEAVASADPEVIRNAPKLILPGVGAFDAAMNRLHERGLVEILNRRVLEDRVPILGICLGMQVMTDSSEEGSTTGLGWISGGTRRFNFDALDPRPRVPHMGWNVVEQARPTPLFEGMYDQPRFYFVHSYHVYCNNQEDVMLTTEYGYRFVSGISRGNIYGVQFHPEKSHKFGMHLIRQFAGI